MEKAPNTMHSTMSKAKETSIPQDKNLTETASAFCTEKMTTIITKMDARMILNCFIIEN